MYFNSPCYGLKVLKVLFLKFLFLWFSPKKSGEAHSCERNGIRQPQARHVESSEWFLWNDVAEKIPTMGKLEESFILFFTLRTCSLHLLL